MGKGVKKASLRGWWKGLPLVVLPFGILFAEAWMRTQILAHNYEAGEMRKSARELESRLEKLQDEESHLMRMSRMEEAAPELELVEPAPGQIVVLTAREGDLADLGYWAEELEKDEVGRAKYEVGSAK